MMTIPQLLVFMFALIALMLTVVGLMLVNFNRWAKREKAAQIEFRERYKERKGSDSETK